MMATSPYSDEDIWKGWTRSLSVRCYESGACTSEEFATNMVDEFKLSITASRVYRKIPTMAQTYLPGLPNHCWITSPENSALHACPTPITHTGKGFCVIRKSWRLSATFSFHTRQVFLNPMMLPSSMSWTVWASRPRQFFSSMTIPGTSPLRRRMGMNAECAKTPEGVIDALNEVGANI